MEKEEEGGYHAFCPILKGCHSQGDTFEDLIVKPVTVGNRSRYWD